MKDAIVVIIICVLGTMIFVSGHEPTPEVTMSWTTQKCVGVKSKGNKYSCENLPEIYDIVWVK